MGKQLALPNRTKRWRLNVDQQMRRVLLFLIDCKLLYEQQKLSLSEKRQLCLLQKLIGRSQPTLLYDQHLRLEIFTFKKTRVIPNAIVKQDSFKTSHIDRKKHETTTCFVRLQGSASIISRKAGELRICSFPRQIQN